MMKKNLFLASFLTVALTSSMVQAIDLSAVKNVANAATSKTTAASTAKTTATKTSNKETNDAAFQKSFQTAIDNSNKKLAEAKTLANNAIWSLGSTVLGEDFEAYKAKKSEEGATDELIDAMNKKLKEQIKKNDIDAYAFENNEAGKKAFMNAVTNLQIAQNRYENITNNMSPNFRKILNGEVSMLNVKGQLVESGKLSKNVKAASMGQSSLLNKLNKIITKQKLGTLQIPESEKVVYNKDGIVGSINYQLDSTNATVNGAYDSLIEAFGLKNEVAKIKADIESKTDAAVNEKGNALQAKQVALNNKANELKEKAKAEGKAVELTSKQSQAIDNATTKLTEAAANYISLGLACTKLGMQISTKPILAAPLALELDQLKYTAKNLKSGASSIKNTLGAVKALKTK